MPTPDWFNKAANWYLVQNAMAKPGGGAEITIDCTGFGGLGTYFDVILHPQ